MNHTQQQINDAWDALKKPDISQKSVEAEAALIPAPKIVVDDEIAQVISLPSVDGTQRDVYGRRPGGVWVSIP